MEKVAWPPAGEADPQGLTVAEAAMDYLSWYRAHREAYADTERAILAHIVPALGGRTVESLTPLEIRRWHEALAATAPRTRRPRDQHTVSFQKDWKETPDNRRARRATANRILTVFKAVLNRAFQEGLVADDRAWRRVKPFPRVDLPVERFLNPSECRDLLKSAETDFRDLIQAALQTGMRYGELIRLKISDFKADQGGLWIHESKSGRPRFVPLDARGVAFFQARTLGRSGGDRLLLRQDGQPWGRCHQIRRIRETCERAGIDPPISFHDLRHTYASLLVQGGVDLRVIADLLGHADMRMTMRHYAHLNDVTRRNALAQLPSWGDHDESPEPP